MDSSTSTSNLIIEEDLLNLAPPPPDQRRLGHSVIPVPQRLINQVSKQVSDIDITFLHENIAKYSILIEYFYLKDHIPKGVYCIPSNQDFSEWHGVIFLHQGLYKDGIFRFVIFIPEDYPDKYPAVRFYSEAFHPLIDKTTGYLDVQELLKAWKTRAKLLLILHYIRDIFYNDEFLFPKPSKARNEEALDFILNDKKKFMEKVNLCIKNAREFFDKPDPEFSLSAPITSNSNIKTIRDMLKTTVHEINSNERKESFLDWLSNSFSSANKNYNSPID